VTSLVPPPLTGLAALVGLVVTDAAWAALAAAAASLIASNNIFLPGLQIFSISLQTFLTSSPEHHFHNVSKPLMALLIYNSTIYR
jgi:hypothetical protein